MNRYDWLDAGLQILAEKGAPAVTIERLCERLGLTKGSFYHHFRTMAQFESDLLTHFEGISTTRFVEAVEQLPSAPPRARLEHLIELVIADAERAHLQVAVRAWALQNQPAREVQERIDRTRLNYVSDLWRDVGHDPESAARLAQLLYLVVIGARQIIPPLPPDNLRTLCALIVSLNPPRPDL